MANNISMEDIVADVSEVLGHQASAVGKDSRLGSPGWDSHAQLRIILAVEEKYGLDLNEFEQEQLFSIQGIFSAVTE